MVKPKYLMKYFKSKNMWSLLHNCVWRKEPILGYVPENDEKKEFRMKRVNVNLFSYMLFMLDAIIFKMANVDDYVFIYIIILHMY